MDVKEHEWVTKAVNNIDRYLHRGGHLKGDEPQLLGGTDLLNTIGVAMGFPFWDPQHWTEDDMQKALKNELVYFEGDARKAIDVIADQIRSCCGEYDKNLVTVLPIELYLDEKLYELPLFRVHHNEDSPKQYVDNIGRCYDSVNDWFQNNKLPSAKMAYPYDLKLTLRHEHDHSLVQVHDTPAARIDSKVLSGIDIAAAVVEIGSGIGLIFATGGFATPLLVAGVAAAIWGTGRAGYQLADRASHGQDINPFTDDESRMLWLGIAANLLGFGAMGASMRMTSLVVRGRNIATSFQILVDVMNGTSVAVSGAAIVDSTVYLIEHYEELSTVDILLHVASMAFWTKSIFKYKTAGALIKNAHNQMFEVISNELSPEDADLLSSIRQQFGNDSQLIKEFHRAVEANVSLKTFSQIVIDAHMQGELQFDGEGNLVLAGGQKYSFEFLSKIPQDIRQHYFDVITNLRADQIELLENFRQRVNNDVNLIKGLAKVAVMYELTPRKATEEVLNFWARYREINVNTNTDIAIKDGNLVLGRAPPIPLKQLQQMSTSVARFMDEHLVHVDDAISPQWTDSIPVLMQLEDHGMFSNCQVTKIAPTGRAVVLLNDNLQISIYKLISMGRLECEKILKFIGQMSSDSFPDEELRLLVNKYRLRMELQRTESVFWMTTYVNARLLAMLNTNLQNFERDRITTSVATITITKATPYIMDAMSFVDYMEPRDVNALITYGEYAINCVEAQKRTLKGELYSGNLKLPSNTKKADFLGQQASEMVLRNPRAMQEKWFSTLDLVHQNVMVEPVELRPGLTDEELVLALIYARVGFGSDTSAACHVLKHPTDPPGAYVERANECVHNPLRWQATLTQDGDARTLRFEGLDGAAVLLEREGRVTLATFSPKTPKPPRE